MSESQEKAASKVVAMADNWYDRRQNAQFAPKSQKARAVGRYEQSGNELAEAVEKYRKTDAGSES